jgi:hypothetical protein
VNRKKINQAMDLMRLPGSYLLRQNSNGKVLYFVCAGAKRIKMIDDETATEVKKHIGINPSQDGLWPGTDQTWRF